MKVNKSIQNSARFGNFIKEYYKPIVALGIGATAAYFIGKALKQFTTEGRRLEAEKKEVEKELTESLKTQPPSFPVSQYQSFARIIQIAGFDLGTDEDAIYSVFNSLKNNTDFLQLTEAWGKPTRTIYDFGIGYKMTLPQFLRWEMDDKEIKIINDILKYKNIKYRV
jgi:hypothetical protein